MVITRLRKQIRQALGTLDYEIPLKKKKPFKEKIDERL